MHLRSQIEYHVVPDWAQHETQQCATLQGSPADLDREFLGLLIRSQESFPARCCRMHILQLNVSGN
jgi:hypothetical protein